jgi:DNA (cytosine-5)-methyltransferase 1
MNEKLRVLDLFSGIGGFSLGLERTGGFETAAFCEIDPFCRQVLAKHWPDVPCHEDIRNLIGDDIGQTDIITAGFPCQPFSSAATTQGSRRGIEDSRFLWPDIHRLVCETRARWLLLENVEGVRTISGGRALGVILSDLAAIGYAAEWHSLDCSLLGAPHSRKRFFLMAYPNSRIQLGCAVYAETPGSSPDEGGHWAHIPRNTGVDDGLSGRMDRLRALGNAVVPQVVEVIGHAILKAEMMAA